MLPSREPTAAKPRAANLGGSSDERTVFSSISGVEPRRRNGVAQPYTPNEAGVTMGHWHLNSRDVAANKKIFVGMGGVDTSDDRFQAVTFPGVLINLNLGGGGQPS